MKTFHSRIQNFTRSGFTLIEMIGVLAVIAILASLLIPKIFEAINNSRVSNASLSYNTVKTALADHFAKYGSLLSSNGTSFPAGTSVLLNFDKVLVSEGFLDKAFSAKIGDSSVGATQHVEVVAALDTSAAPTTTDSRYSLAGDNVNEALGSAVAQVVIPGVLESDARALSLLLDGPAMSSAAIGSDDTSGRVKYAATSPTVVYIYLTHR